MGWVVKSRGYKSVIVDDEGLISAEVCGPHHAKHARVMAAAPEMVELARMLVHVAERVPFTGQFHDAVAAARAILARIDEEAV